MSRVWKKFGIQRVISTGLTVRVSWWIGMRANSLWRGCVLMVGLSLRHHKKWPKNPLVRRVSCGGKCSQTCRDYSGWWTMIISVPPDRMSYRRFVGMTRYGMDNLNKYSLAKYFHWSWCSSQLGGGFEYVWCSSLFGEDRFPCWLILFRWFETTNHTITSFAGSRTLFLVQISPKTDHQQTQLSPGSTLETTGRWFS